ESSLPTACAEGSGVVVCLRSQYSSFSRDIAALLGAQGLQSVSARARKQEDAFLAKAQALEQESKKALEQEKAQLARKAEAEAKALKESFDKERRQLYTNLGHTGAAFALVLAGAYLWRRRSSPADGVRPAAAAEATAP